MKLYNKKNIFCVLALTLLMLCVSCYVFYCSYSLSFGFAMRRVMFIILIYIFVCLHFYIQPSKLYEFIFKNRLWIALFIFAFLVINRFNFSSIGMFDSFVQPSHSPVYSHPLFGTARAIRSDEWMVDLPRKLSTDYAGYGKFNNIARGTTTENISTSGLYLNYSALVHPADWGFYLFKTSEIGISWYWCFKMVFGFLASFEFCYILTKKDQIMGLFGGTIIWFSQFCMWWSITTFLFVAMASIALFYHFIVEKKYVKKIVFGLGMAIFVANFIVDLYPAWQVPMGWLCLSIVLYLIIDNWNCIKKYKIVDWLILGGVIVFLISIVVVFFYNFYAYIEAISGTVYPGARVSYGGNVISKSCRYFSSVLSPYIDFDNPCEMGNFYGVFPLGLMMGVVVLIYKKGKVLSLWLISIPTTLFLLYCTVGVDKSIATISLMSNSTPERTVDILGFACVLMLIISLSELKEKKINLIIALFLSVFNTVIAVRTEYLSGLETNRFLFVCILAFVTIVIETIVIANYSSKARNVAIAFATSFIMVTGLSVNPLMYGISTIREKPVASEISKIVESDKNAKWIALDSLTNGNFLIACGASTYNSTNFIPNIKLWSKIDKNGDYENIYNRYAHIVISLVDDETSFELVQPDFIRVYLSYSDLNILDVDYICSVMPIETQGFELQYEEDGILLYKYLGTKSR